MFGRRLSHAGHASHDHGHPVRRRVLFTLLAAGLLAALALLIAPPHAHGNFVYWTVGAPGNTIGRAKINGTGQNNNFVPGLSDPRGLAVDSNFIYWSQGDAATGSIGRANLNGSGVNADFIPHSAGVSEPRGVAVTPTAIYWSNGNGTIGRANIGGSGPVPDFITLAESSCDLAADANFLYFLGVGGLHIGRATLDGSSVDPTFISNPEAFCGPAVDSSFLYWASDGGNTVGRVPVGGGTAQAGFVAAGTTSGGPTDVAVNSQYVFWGNSNTGAIGRANINGSSPNPALITGAVGMSLTNPSRLTAAPSNKITVNSTKKNKKKGTATINAKVPGPGQVTLNQTSTPPDANATAASVKQVGLTVPQASSFTLPVKPKGKTAKKLKKQLKTKRTAKVKVKVFIHFVPAGVAGVPNDQQVTVTLVKQRKK